MSFKTQATKFVRKREELVREREKSFFDFVLHCIQNGDFIDNDLLEKNIELTKAKLKGYDTFSLKADESKMPLDIKSLISGLENGPKNKILGGANTYPFQFTVTFEEGGKAPNEVFFIYNEKASEILKHADQKYKTDLSDLDKKYKDYIKTRPGYKIDTYNHVKAELTKKYKEMEFVGNGRFYIIHTSSRCIIGPFEGILSIKLDGTITNLEVETDEDNVEHGLYNPRITNYVIDELLITDNTDINGIINILNESLYDEEVDLRGGATTYTNIPNVTLSNFFDADRFKKNFTFIEITRDKPLIQAELPKFHDVKPVITPSGILSSSDSDNKLEELKDEIGRAKNLILRTKNRIKDSFIEAKKELESRPQFGVAKKAKKKTAIAASSIAIVGVSILYGPRILEYMSEYVLDSGPMYGPHEEKVMEAIVAAEKKEQRARVMKVVRDAAKVPLRGLGRVANAVRKEMWQGAMEGEAMEGEATEDVSLITIMWYLTIIILCILILTSICNFLYTHFESIENLQLKSPEDMFDADADQQDLKHFLENGVLSSVIKFIDSISEHHTAEDAATAFKKFKQTDEYTTPNMPKYFSLIQATETNPEAVMKANKEIEEAKKANKEIEADKKGTDAETQTRARKRASLIENISKAEKAREVKKARDEAFRKWEADIAEKLGDTRRANAAADNAINNLKAQGFSDSAAKAMFDSLGGGRTRSNNRRPSRTRYAKKSSKRKGNTTRKMKGGGKTENEFAILGIKLAVLNILYMLNNPSVFIYQLETSDFLYKCYEEILNIKFLKTDNIGKTLRSKRTASD